VLVSHGCCSGCRGPDQSPRHGHRRQDKQAKRTDRKQSETTLTAWTLWPSGLWRWLKAPFQKGVGSHSTGVISHGGLQPLASPTQAKPCISSFAGHLQDTLYSCRTPPQTTSSAIRQPLLTLSHELEMSVIRNERSYKSVLCIYIYI